MAIHYDDIKLMKSQRLDDSDEGGGHMTGNEVVDGEINNLFPDISRLDRTYGRVQLRKAFPAVYTNTTNPLYGSHIIITKPAADQKVKCCMFTTKSSTDTRKDAVDRLEQYVVVGYRLFSYILMGKHVAGSQALLVQQDSTDELPSVNEVLYLEESSGSSGEYVKIKKVTILKEADNKRQLELDLWAPLQHEHDGFYYDGNGRMIIETYFYNTVVADAMHYYGISKLVQPASAGDTSVKVSNIFHNLVPIAQSNEGINNDALPPFGRVEAGADDKKTLAQRYVDTNSEFRLYCLRPVVAGSVKVTISGSSTYLYDDGNGNLYKSSTNTVCGSIEYVSGILYVNALGYGSRTLTVTAIPGAQPTRRMHTLEYYVTTETRTNTFSRTLLPKLLPGSLVIKYRAQGKWYSLYDQGDGTIAGTQPAYGTGTIDYSESSVLVTLGALPDVGSSVIFQWATSERFEIKGGTQTGEPYIVLEFDHQASPNSVTITYTANGTQYTVTDDGNGNLQGDGSGKVYYSDKRIELIPDYLPDIGTAIELSYYETADETTEQYQTSELTDNGDTWTIQLGNPILRGTLELTFARLWETVEHLYPRRHENYKLCDDGNGKLAGDPNSSIDYSTGTVTFSKHLALWSEKYHYEKECWWSGGGGSWVRSCSWYRVSDGWDYHEYRNYDAVEQNTFTFKYAAADTTTTHNQTYNDYMITLDLHSLATHFTVPGSLWVSWNGNNIIDDDGKLYNGRDASNGSFGVQVGTYDYHTGKATFFDWTSGAAKSVGNVISAVLATRDQEITNCVFTTSGSPVQVGSFQLIFTRADTGEEISVIADNSGYISGSGVEGYIDYEFGVVRCDFGVWVPKAGNENEPWYSEAFVQGDQVLKPIPVLASSIRYNAVIINFIPLDPSILGLNPLRLPTDGRVPIYRVGDVVVIHNNQEYTMPNNLQPGQQIALPRGNLSYVDLFDQNGKYVDKQWYSVDLEQGIITMSDPLDLSAYTQPLIAYHRREDMRLLTDVQIDGTLSLIEPIDHDYDTDYTYVSSALLMGDLYASVYNVFDQKNWTGEWSDSRIGDPCTANYNIIDYPIETTNKGAIQERWAIIFTSSTEFKVVGEHVGEIHYGNINEDCAPINPETQVPYFTIRKEGWGGGWATNNVLRFNTTAAHYPVWFVRTVLIGDATADDDNFRIQIRGDAD